MKLIKYSTKSKNSNNIPVCIEIDVEGNVQTITDDPKGIANAFNSHYTTVADKILSKLEYREIKAYYRYLVFSNDDLPLN